jgi:hypothetical protein
VYPFLTLRVLLLPEAISYQQNSVCSSLQKVNAMKIFVLGRDTCDGIHLHMPLLHGQRLPARRRSIHSSNFLLSQVDCSFSLSVPLSLLLHSDHTSPPPANFQLSPLLTYPLSSRSISSLRVLMHPIKLLILFLLLLLILLLYSKKNFPLIYSGPIQTSNFDTICW